MTQTRIVLAISILPLLAVVAWGLSGLPRLDFLSGVWAPPGAYGVLGIAAGSAAVAGIGGIVAGALGEGVGLQVGLAGRSSFAVSLLAGTPGVLIAFALLAGGLGLLRGVGLDRAACSPASGLASRRCRSSRRVSRPRPGPGGTRGWARSRSA